MSNSNARFAREQLAGYDPDTLRDAVATIVGCGAAGNNLALNFALVGVGELRFVDFDMVEESNLTRSPLFDKRRVTGKRRRFKGREIALGALATSYAENPAVRFALSRVEEIGLGGLEGSSVVLSAVDSLDVRAYLADVTRLLGIPLIEMGFSGTRGQVSVFSNRKAEEPCWRCLHPHVSHGAISCSLYAQRATAAGRIPATQPLAAHFGGLAAEHAIRAIHGEFPLSGKAVHFDLLHGRSRVLEIALDDACPGVHRVFPTARALDVNSGQKVDALFEVLRLEMSEPIVILPAPFIVEAPCTKCGAGVAIGKPAWAVSKPPLCKTCPTVVQLGGDGMHVLTTFEAGDGMGRRRLRDIGLPAGAIFEIEDGQTGKIAVVKLSGAVSDLFETKTRSNGKRNPAMSRANLTTKEPQHG